MSKPNSGSLLDGANDSPPGESVRRARVIDAKLWLVVGPLLQYQYIPYISYIFLALRKTETNYV